MFARILDSLARFIARKPGIVVTAVAILLILSLYSAQNVKIVHGMDTFFSESNKVYRQYQLYEKDFGVGKEDVFIFIKGEEVVTREIYDYMLSLEEEIGKISGVGGTVSPASVVKKIVGTIPTDEVLLKQLTETYASSLIPRPTMAIIIVHITTTDDVKQDDIARNIERILSYTPSPPGIVVQVTGGPVLGYQIEQEIQKNLKTTMAISILLMVFILFTTFSGAVRKKYTAFMPLLISIFAVAIVYGLMPFLGIPLSEHTNGALPMLIGLAIEYAAQLQNRYEEERLSLIHI